MSTSDSDYYKSQTEDKPEKCVNKSWQETEDEYKAELMDCDEDDSSLLNLHIDDVVFFWVNF